MAGQDFRQIVQGKQKNSCQFYLLLRRNYCVAFGSDKLSKETKDAMLYATPGGCNFSL